MGRINMRRAICIVWLMLLLGSAASGWGEDDLTQAVLRQTAEDYKVFQKSV